MGRDLKLLHAAPRVLHDRISAGPHRDTIAFVPRILMNNDDDELSSAFERRQFLIAPAFAMMINKAQGQSPDHLVL